MTEGYTVVIDGEVVDDELENLTEVEAAIEDYFDSTGEDPDDCDVEVFETNKVEVDVETSKKVKVTFN